ncbi:MAG: restriction endonuclease subunit S [Chloroflexi bacterium]|nr:restriction endonuclease subunit S [Chloroflexota bacterium]
MIADLKPYAEYKESGLPWLGQVPGHWETRPAFGAFLPNHDRNRGMKEKTVLSLSYGRIIIKPPEKLHGLVPESFETYQIVNPGDIILRTVDLQNDHTSLRVGMVRNRGIITSAYLALRVNAGVNADFGFQFLNVWDSSKAIYGYGSGLRQNLNFAHFKRMPVAVPPPDEQAAIVRFLDWANGRLERAIRAKRKVIALLNEQKQAIIHRAVTRGLDPSVPLKPSGIPWLGDIPQHWSLKRFKFLATINSGQVDPRKAEYRALVLIAPNHIQSGSGRLLKQETAEEQGADSGKYLVRRGQVIYSKIRPNLRKAVIAPCDCLCSADMYPIDPTTGELATDYLLLLLLSQPFTKFAVDTSMRVAMPKVNREALANCLMWYPGAHEQLLILEFIAREGAPIDNAISRLEREIELLREYRTRLVADVVTGKLDVREAAARLPDEAPLDTVEDDADLGDETETADEEAAV